MQTFIDEKRAILYDAINSGILVFVAFVYPLFLPMSQLDNRLFPLVCACPLLGSLANLARNCTRYLRAKRLATQPQQGQADEGIPQAERLLRILYIALMVCAVAFLIIVVLPTMRGYASR